MSVCLLCSQNAEIPKARLAEMEGLCRKCRKRISSKKWNHSEKGQAFWKTRRASPEYKEMQRQIEKNNRIPNKKAAQKYRQSEKAKATRKQWIEQNAERMKKYKQRYFNSNKGQVFLKQHRQRNAQKIKARRMVNNRIHSGTIPKSSQFNCCICGSRASEYHHWLGYELEFALSVIPVCKSCHKTLN